MRATLLRLRGPFVAFAIGITVFLVMISLLQKRLIYFPARASEAALLKSANRLDLDPWRDDEGTIIGWKSSTVEDTPAARLVIFHGNAGFALHRNYFVHLPPQDWQVFLFEYPGYGSRAGSPGENAIKAAALEGLDVISTPKGPPVFLVGESIGSGVATWLALQRPEVVAGLLLITPMTSLVEVGAHHYPFLPVRLLMSERYDSLKPLETYVGPVAFVLAGRDQIIPPDIGRQLYKAYAGPKRLWEQSDAGHNSVDYSPAWWEKVFEFLAAPSHGN